MQLLFHPGYVRFHARRGGMVLHRTFILWHGETELFFFGGGYGGEKECYSC